MVFHKVLTALDEEDLKQIEETGVFVIPDDVDEIGDGVFCNLPRSITIVIPKNVKKIGAFAFDNTVEAIKFLGPVELHPDALGALEGCYPIILDDKLYKNEEFVESLNELELDKNCELDIYSDSKYTKMKEAEKKRIKEQEEWQKEHDAFWADEREM